MKPVFTNFLYFVKRKPEIEYHKILMINLKTIKPYCLKTLKVFRKVLTVLGFILLLSVLLSFTDCPFWAYYWLGTYNAKLTQEPNVLVVMGGGGMPGPDGLLRCFFTSEIAKEILDSRIIIAIPGDTAKHEKSPELLMAQELILRGIDSSRILYENKGHNTRSQAVNIRKMFHTKNIDSVVIRIVTSPDHMFRSVAAFHKVGFQHVGGRPSFEEAIDEEILVRKDITRKELQAATRKLNLRYNMWNYMKYEITVLREWCAIAYYKLKGWI